MAVAERLAAVRARIETAARSAGRDPREITLLPVSKFHRVEDIATVRALGCRLFGENRPQELASKHEALPNTRFAMIGHLQRNKAKLIVEHAAELHSLDSFDLAEDLDHRLHDAGRSLPVLIQVNTSDESQKTGIHPNDAVSFARSLSELKALEVRGLMTMAMISKDRKEVASCFRRLRNVQARLREAAPLMCWDTLSMGMSGDFEIAIEEGSTMVRVGTAIFGDRKQG